MNFQDIIWQPIGVLPALIELLEQQLVDAGTQLNNLQRCIGRPHVLDDETLDRVVRLYTDQRDFLNIYREQIVRWTSEGTTPQQNAAFERFSALIVDVDSALGEVLTLATKLSPGTLDKVLGMADGDLAVAVMRGDMPLPSATVNVRREIASYLDQRMQALSDLKLDELGILGDMHDCMAGFKQLTDTAGPGEFDQLTRQFPGLMQFAQVLTSVARKVSAGQIQVP